MWAGFCCVKIEPCGGSCADGDKTRGCLIGGLFLEQLSDCQLPKKVFSPCNQVACVSGELCRWLYSLFVTVKKLSL
jgi:hypothetical protein